MDLTVMCAKSCWFIDHGSQFMVYSYGNTHWKWSWLGKMDIITDWSQRCCSQFMVTCSCFVHKEIVLVVSWIMDQMGQWIIVLWGFIYACMCLPEHLEAVSALLMCYYPKFAHFAQNFPILALNFSHFCSKICPFEIMVQVCLFDTSTEKNCWLQKHY